MRCKLNVLYVVLLIDDGIVNVHCSTAYALIEPKRETNESLHR